MVTLYDNIKSLCEERDTTVSAMCETIGISKSTLSNLKNGRSETISAKTARKIASFLIVPVDEVLHGQKETPAAPKNDGVAASEKARYVFENYDKMPPELKAIIDNAVEMYKKTAPKD